MPLSREEIGNIGKEAADRVIKSAQACRCGLAVWDTRTNIASIEAVILHQQADWLQPISRLQQDTLTIVERDCGVDMTKAKELSARLENDIKKLDWQEARADLVFLRGAIQGRFVECAAEESQSPPGWVYVKVGTTEVRGRKVPDGIAIEQVSPSFNQDDFDKAVRIIEEKLKSQREEESSSNPGGQHVTIEDPGKTTFKPGEVISKETFDKENERVRKLGEKPATAKPSGEPKEHHYVVKRNEPYGTWRIEELWPEGTVRSPFTTSGEAIERERVIAEHYGFLDTLYLDNAEET